MPNFDRTLWRAANDIVAALETQRRGGEPVLPVTSWLRLEELARQLRTARRRGWTAAARQLHEAFHSQAEWITGECQRLGQRTLPPAGDAPLRVPDVYAELCALRDRFDGFEVDLVQTQVSVLSEAVALEDVDLGPFRLVWNWSDLAEEDALRVIAETPQPPAHRDGVTHPHVQDGLLCEGQAQSALKLASDSGRLFDYFEIVERVLQTYNPESAYVALSDWNSQRCCGCGGPCDPDDLASCETCYEFFCPDCQAICSGCHGVICYDCSLTCLVCDQPLCRNCRSTRAGRAVCPACLKKELSHDDDDETPPAADAPAEDDAAVHADRLGPAAVPARRR